MTGLSNDVQRNTVSLGMAYALVALDHFTLANDKLTLEHAFSVAFRGWSYAHVYPTVGRDTALAGTGVDPIWVLFHYDKDKQRPYAPIVWELDGPDWEVRLRKHSDWNPDNGNDVERIRVALEGESVPLSAWLDLGRSFLVNLRELESD